MAALTWVPLEIDEEWEVFTAALPGGGQLVLVVARVGKWSSLAYLPAADKIV